MKTEPQDEHRWLDQLAGKWHSESVCDMGPDKPPMTHVSTMTTRSLGGLWLLIDMQGEATEFGQWTNQFTLGYDPEPKKFVGSFVASMMAMQWIYSGQLSADKRKLILDTVGPKMDGTEGKTNYQDIFEIVDADNWILTSQWQGDDGNWTLFMTATQRRVK